VKDILKETSHKELLAQSNVVIDKFRNTRLKMFLKDLQVQKETRFSLIQGCLTRWASTLKQMRKLLYCKSAIFAVLGDPSAAPYIGTVYLHYIIIITIS